MYMLIAKDGGKCYTRFIMWRVSDRFTGQCPFSALTEKKSLKMHVSNILNHFSMKIVNGKVFLLPFHLLE